MEDFNQLRRIAKKLGKTEFQAGWLFRLEFVGVPMDFDFFVKDVSYGVFTIATDEDQCGGATFVWPTGVQACRISVTVRDHVDGRVREALLRWRDEVIHPDGTVGLPFGDKGYVRRVRIFNLRDGGQETLESEREMYPEQVGETSRSREQGEWQEIPVTFVQFSTLDATGMTAPAKEKEERQTSTGGKGQGTAASNGESKNVV